MCWFLPCININQSRVLFFSFLINHFWSLSWICYTIVSVVYIMVFWLRGMWDPSSLSLRGWTHTPHIRRWSSNHGTAREVPLEAILKDKSFSLNKRRRLCKVLKPRRDTFCFSDNSIALAIMPFAEVWMDLEMIVLSEVNQKDKDI